MKKNSQRAYVMQILFFVFLVTVTSMAITPIHGASLQMPVSASSGATKSLSVHLDVDFGTYTLSGPSPTASNGPNENPVVKARGVKLTHSKPAASPSAQSLLIGPTLRVRPGDKLNILFKNNLS